MAAARVLDPDYRIPLAVVTNGRDAELLETARGRVLATGLDCIPNRRQAGDLAQHCEFAPYADPGLRDKALRILNVFDREICCAGSDCAPAPGE